MKYGPSALAVSPVLESPAASVNRLGLIVAHSRLNRHLGQKPFPIDFYLIGVESAFQSLASVFLSSYRSPTACTELLFLLASKRCSIPAVQLPDFSSMCASVFLSSYILVDSNPKLVS